MRRLIDLPHATFRDQPASRLVRGDFSARWVVYGWRVRLVLVAAAFFFARELRAEEPARPEFAAVAQAVADRLASRQDYQPGDLLSQRHVAGAVEAVAGIGWAVPDAEKIVARALADDSFLVRELSRPAGRKFMRKIARHTGAYARLDRLSSISRGETLIRDLVRQKDGDKLIEYLATTPGGRNLGNMMAGTRGGGDLNKPTDRIYTADDLVATLEKLYKIQTP